MDDIFVYYTAILAALFLGLTLLICILLDIRAQAEERKELNRLLIMALFRMSKDQIKTLEDQTRHADARGIALLRALRGGNASAALLAEVRRDCGEGRGAAAHARSQDPAGPGDAGDLVRLGDWLMEESPPYLPP